MPCRSLASPLRLQAEWRKTSVGTLQVAWRKSSGESLQAEWRKSSGESSQAEWRKSSVGSMQSEWRKSSGESCEPVTGPLARHRYYSADSTVPKSLKSPRSFSSIPFPSVSLLLCHLPTLSPPLCLCASVFQNPPYLTLRTLPKHTRKPSRESE